MIKVLRSGHLLWTGEANWSPREFFTRLTSAVAAVSSYQHDLTFWRGHADSDWTLSPRLVRELPLFAIAQDVVDRETAVLLDEARRARPAWLEGMSLKGSSDLDLLSLLQHLGAATPFLDLTTDPFVALYFAVAGESRDGLLIGLQTRHWLDLTPTPSSYSKDWAEQVRSLKLENGRRIAYFRPPNISARIPAQRSVLAFGVVPSKGSWAHSLGAMPIDELSDTWSEERANLAFGRSSSPGRPGLPPVLGFHVPRRRKPFIRHLLATNFGLSAVSLFPDPQGFGDWRLRQERQWNQEMSATGAQEVDRIEGLTDRQKLSTFRAIWGKSWVTREQYEGQYGLTPDQARADIEALINAAVILRREDGQLIEGPVIDKLRSGLGIGAS